MPTISTLLSRGGKTTLEAASCATLPSIPFHPDDAWNGMGVGASFCLFILSLRSPVESHNEGRRLERKGQDLHASHILCDFFSFFFLACSPSRVYLVTWTYSTQRYILHRADSIMYPVRPYPMICAPDCSPPWESQSDHPLALQIVDHLTVNQTFVRVLNFGIIAL